MILTVVTQSQGVAKAAIAFDHITHEITLDPVGGVVSGTAAITAQDESAAIGEVSLVLDKGLSVGGAIASGGSFVKVTQQPYKNDNYVVLSLSPPAAVGAALTIEVSYDGTLACEAAGSSTQCDYPPGKLARFNTGSVMVRPIDPQSGSIVLSTQNVTLHTPSGKGVFMGADPVESKDDGTMLTTRWKIAKPAFGFTAVFSGDFESVAIPGTAVPFSFHHSPGDGDWGPKLQAWIPPAVNFVTNAVGDRPVPFEEVHLYKFGPEHGDKGYTGYAHIALSALHSDPGDEFFEEVWAHEISHFWFGVTALPGDVLTQRMLTEGLATLTQYDYTAARYYAEVDRDIYLGRRYREADLLLRYGGMPVTATPVVVADPKDTLEADDPISYFAWAYHKAPATLDYLRTTIGEQAFSTGVSGYLDQCMYLLCTVDDFQAVMEAASGKDLEAFFATFVRASNYPKVEIAFSQPDSFEHVRVELAQSGKSSVALELWVELLNGDVEKHPLMLEGPDGAFVLPTTGAVRSVRPNPRQEVFVHAYSRTEGDVNLDGDADGFDVLHAAYRYGKSGRIDSGGRSVLFDLDVEFDPRCDFDVSGELDDADLEHIISSFGQRGAP